MKEIREISGYPSVDKPWLKYFSREAIETGISDMNIYDFFLFTAPDDVVLMEYEGLDYYKKDIEKEVSIFIRIFSDMGISHGDNISLMMLNVPQAFFIYQALAKIGAIANLIRPDENPERIAYMNSTRNVKLMFVSGVSFIIDNVKTCLSSMNQVKEVVVVPYLDMGCSEIKNLNTFLTFDEWCCKHSGSSGYSYNSTFEDVSVVVFTGGTTGNPKAVELTNKNIVTVAHDFLYGGYGFEKGMTSMNVLPIGIAYNIVATYNMMCCGVKVINIANFIIDKYPELMEQYKPNIVFSGPILFGLMMKEDISQDLSFLKMPYSGGDKLLLNEEKAFNEYLHSRGSLANVYQGYGMSECMAGGSVTRKDDYVIGSVGVPMPSVTISIFDYHDKKTEKKYGEIGEICISGPTIMKGYGNSDNVSDSVLIKHSDGKTWLHTDDLGYMDENGHLFIHGRAKRMLTRSGVKVWLNSLEETIKKHKSVNNCCCVKMHDSVEREVPVAHLSIKKGIDAIQTCEEIERLIINELPLVFLPKYYVIRKDIPLTSGNNKIDFKTLEKEDIFNENEYVINGRIIIHKSH